MYHDQEGNECTLLQLCGKEPEWAANRILSVERELCDLRDQRNAEHAKVIRLTEELASLRGAEKAYTDHIAEQKNDIARLKRACQALRDEVAYLDAKSYD